MVAFHDIKPDCKVHIQVVPKTHIVSIKTLGPEHIPLVQHMHKVGLQVLADSGHKGEQKYVFRFSMCGCFIPCFVGRFGFHVPPHTSVKHLHMHALGLPCDGLRARFQVWAPSWCFEPVGNVLRALQRSAGTRAV